MIAATLALALLGPMVLDAPASKSAASSEQLEPYACAVGASLGGMVLADVATAALGATVIGGMFVIDQSQGTAFRGAFVAAAAVIAMPLAGPIGAAVALTILLSASAETIVFAWQPAVVGIGLAVGGAVVVLGAAAVSLSGVRADAAFVALGSAFVLSTVGVVVGGIWAASDAAMEARAHERVEGE